MALLIELRAGRSSAARPVSAGLEAAARRVSWLARYAAMSAVGGGAVRGIEPRGEEGAGEAAVGVAGLAGRRPSAWQGWRGGRRSDRALRSGGNRAAYISSFLM